MNMNMNIDRKFHTVVDCEDAIVIERDGVNHRLRRGRLGLLRRLLHIRHCGVAVAAAQGARSAAEGAGPRWRSTLHRHNMIDVLSQAL